MKKYIIIFSLCLLTLISSAQVRLHSEAVYKDSLQKFTGGKREVLLADKSRADLVWGDYAIEVTFANVFYSAIGQALYYAQGLNKKPGIIMIIENATDEKFISKVINVAETTNIKVWIIRGDFSFYAVNVSILTNDIPLNLSFPYKLKKGENTNFTKLR